MHVVHSNSDSDQMAKLQLQLAVHETISRSLNIPSHICVVLVAAAIAIQ